MRHLRVPLSQFDLFGRPFRFDLLEMRQQMLPERFVAVLDVAAGFRIGRLIVQRQIGGSAKRAQDSVRRRSSFPIFGVDLLR